MPSIAGWYQSEACKERREAKAQALSQGHGGDFGANPIDDQAAAIILTTWLNEQ